MHDKYEVWIDTSKMGGLEIIPFDTLDKAYEEFLNQIDYEKAEGYECSRDVDGNPIDDGLMLFLVHRNKIGTPTCLMQYDNRFSHNRLSLKHGDPFRFDDGDEVNIDIHNLFAIMDD